jgi:hypothetical protein
MAPEPMHDAVFDELVRCPSCGSLNDDDAEFCGQCYASFSDAEAPADPNVNVLGESLVDPQPMLTDETSGLFGVEKGQPVWRCARCFTRNPVESDVCSECGLPWMESARREADSFTQHLAEDTGKTTMGIMSWNARIMMVVGGLLAPIVLFWGALAAGVAYVLKKALGRD